MRNPRERFPNCVWFFIILVSELKSWILPKKFKKISTFLPTFSLSSFFPCLCRQQKKLLSHHPHQPTLPLNSSSLPRPRQHHLVPSPLQLPQCQHHEIRLPPSSQASIRVDNLKIDITIPLRFTPTSSMSRHNRYHWGLSSPLPPLSSPSTSLWTRPLLVLSSTSTLPPTQDLRRLNLNCCLDLSRRITTFLTFLRHPLSSSLSFPEFVEQH